LVVWQRLRRPGHSPGLVGIVQSEGRPNERMQQTKGRLPRLRPFAADPRCSTGSKRGVTRRTSAAMASELAWLRRRPSLWEARISSGAAPCDVRRVFPAAGSPLPLARRSLSSHCPGVHSRATHGVPRLSQSGADHFSSPLLGHPVVACWRPEGSLKDSHLGRRRLPSDGSLTRCWRPLPSGPLGSGDAPCAPPAALAFRRVVPLPRRSALATDGRRRAALGRPSNEALQQTRSALTTVAAALAAERRCWADL